MSVKVTTTSSTSSGPAAADYGAAPSPYSAQPMGYTPPAQGPDVDIYGRTLGRDDQGDLGVLPQLAIVDPGEYARRNQLVYDASTGRWDDPANVRLRARQRGAPQFEQLLRKFQAEQGAPAEVVAPGISFFGPWYNRRWMYGACGGCCGLGMSDQDIIRMAYVPKILNHADITRANCWIPVDHVFPVDCTSPNATPPIGMAIVHYFRVQTIMGQPFMLYGVMKITPYQVGVGEDTQYHGALYEVPEGWCTPVKYAIMAVYTAYTNSNVSVAQDDGTAFAMDLAELQSSANPELQRAKQRLFRDYPTISGTVFSTRYVETPTEVLQGPNQYLAQSNAFSRPRVRSQAIIQSTIDQPLLSADHTESTLDYPTLYPRGISSELATVLRPIEMVMQPTWSMENSRSVLQPVVMERGDNPVYL